jgi:undecaprenyl-diphosphatase
MTFWDAFVLAVVEGLTEYLPISSTGHIILSSWMLGIHEEPFVKDFTVMVQFGAIAAVVMLYWRRFFLNVRLYPKLVVGFLPAGVIGWLLKSHIDILLGSVTIVGWALMLGGVLLVWTDRWLKNHKPTVMVAEELSWRQVLGIGLVQTLAFIPGVSRAAATIWGGLWQGLSLKAATEFSFFLAVPTLAGAGFLKLVKAWPTLTEDQLQYLVLGNAVSFLVGALAIRSFVALVQRFGLRHFGYYRIAVGLLVLTVAWTQGI